jgi:nucleoside phosphorylase
MDNGMGAIRKGREDYTVGWVSALPLEMAVAIAMLDERHGPLQSVAEDDNVYELGQISGHNVVIACLPSGVYGTTSAAAVASNMLRSFPKIMYGLMVGIAGGALREGVDIRLGDVVVGHPTGTEGGVVQYDFGKILSGGQVQRTGMLNKPPPRLLTAVANLRAKHASGENKVQKFMQDMLDRHPDMTKFNHPPGPEKDKLFKSTYVHRAAEATCATCKEEELVARTERPECTIHPVAIHYGLVASGYRVIKDGLTRDRLARELGVLCFEMEAAGLVDHFPSLTIRGICDYCDSHKNKEWQEYAATAAAAYAKDLLCVVPKQVHDNSTS